MDIVICFFEQCARSPKLDSSASHLTELKVGQPTDLVYSCIKLLPADPLNLATKRKRCGGNGRKRKATRPAKASKGAESSSSSDVEFSPQPTPTSSGLDKSPSESEISEDKIRREQKSPDTRKRQKMSDLADLDATKAVGDQVHVNATQPLEYIGRKRGRDPIVRAWAFSHHEKPIEGFYPNTNSPAWAFKCKYCSYVHHFPRTLDDVSKEKISATNLAGHLKVCNKLPSQYKLAALKNRANRQTETLTLAQASLGEMFRSARPTPSPISITPSIFRSTLIQGVVRDNYPLTFGEGKGMRQLFAMISPGLDLPVHSTMRKDLNKLHVVLSNRVSQVLNAQNSRFAVTSDAWTSKSFVYSLGGVVVTFIDRSWNLQEFVLDIVHLDADHTGAGMGRKIFKSLDQMGAAKSIVASVTDNASNNRTMNTELSAWLSKKHGYHLNIDHMSILCLCHALHLVCGAIFSDLKVMDPMDNDEQYAIVKSFEEGKIFEQNAEVLEEEERLQNEEAEAETQMPSIDVSKDELDGLETGDQPNMSLGSSSQPSQSTPTNNELNCVQKVHSIVVDITSSAACRKRMRTITRALGLEPRAVIKSVKVRWNSILAEIRRAILLKAAINQYISTLDEGKSGISLRRARALKKKWTISDEEWDALEELVRILEPFEAATRDYSRRGRTVLHSVLPTYLVLREKLCQSRLRLSTASFGSNVFDALVEALKAGEEKLKKYFDLALKSDLTLLASGAQA